MTKSIRRMFAPTLVLGLLLCSGTASAFTLVCESNDRATHYCPADTRGGVTLSVQFSKASCRQGSSWGYDNRGIWVSNGCRAQFDIAEYRSRHESNRDSKAAAALAIGLIGAAVIASQDRNDRQDPGYSYRPERHDHSYGPQSRITCESVDGRERFCPANLRHADVDIETQLSSTVCRHGSNWGWDSDGIWVSNGCRAVFAVY